ncbi:ABC transporter ATP-binding protein [Youngiibacter fragilis]|uniref:ABC transporter n=1 Tax=Youngiibacter fragilis 232.1 TaxID=994573 RepID=V7HZV1_9CLOT|nr:ABC transporter ATP-binding protein [Youngiibacter fragilis]ETA79138.1 ABC transporter [Youngiibacter fragilis 232.1]
MSENRSTTQQAQRPGPGPGGPMGMGRIVEKPKDFKGTMKKLLQYLSPYRLKLLLVIIFAAGSAVFSIAGPKILGTATTKLYQGLVAKVSGTGGIDFDSILRTVLFLAGLYLVSSALMIIQGFIVSGVSQKVSYSLRKEISEKINRLPLKFYDTRTHGEILSRVTNDVDTLSQTLNQSMSQMISSLTTLVGVLVMMLSISVTMTVAAILILPLSLGIVMTVLKKSQVYFKKQAKLIGNLNGHVEEVYGGHLIMKAFNGEEKAIGAFDVINDELKDVSFKAQLLSGLLMPLMGFVGNLGYVAVSILGGYLAGIRAIEVGDILSFIQYVRNFTQPINQVAQISNIFQSTVAASERVFEFLGQPEMEAEAEETVTIEEVTGEVEFENVHFGYTEDRTIINDFSAKAMPGQRIAIVGPTGAGKTTVVKLLMRFYEITGGRILIDGVDIRDMKRSELRKSFGMVLQDTWLFSGSIMENIRYGSPDATDEEVICAAKEAHVHHFVKTLPGTYSMEINEEASNISSGQKQLLTIARAVLKDPRILILDEATSSVDTRTERLIQEAMERLMKGRTSFIIAHRLSTIRNADLILVMDHGDIVEIGNHEELMEKKGFYHNLYNSQFEDKETA